jgi:hypothetical protein
MATVTTQRTAALAELKILAQTASTPALDNSTEVEPILDSFKRASMWVAATAYAYGDVVVPTVLNGRMYRCTTKGTSGASEPDWPDEGLWGGCKGAREWLTVTDGNVDWEDAGALPQVYDVRAAAVRCVQAKLGKVGAASVSASVGASWSADGVSVNRGGNAGESLREPLLELLRSLQLAGVA